MQGACEIRRGVGGIRVAGRVVTGVVAQDLGSMTVSAMSAPMARADSHMLRMDPRYTKA